MIGTSGRRRAAAPGRGARPGARPRSVGTRRLLATSTQPEAARKAATKPAPGPRAATKPPKVAKPAKARKPALPRAAKPATVSTSKPAAKRVAPRSADAGRLARQRERLARLRPQRASRRPPTRPPAPMSRAERRRAAQRRQTRLMMVGAVVIAAVAMAAWFPLSALLQQRQALAATSSQLTQLQKEDAGLKQEKKNLANPAEVARIARQQYQLVKPGQHVYQVLPPSDSGGNATDPYSGDPGLKGPVSPSAYEPPGPAGTAASTGSGTNGSTGASGTSSTGQATATNGRSSLLQRMVQTLEFWR